MRLRNVKGSREVIETNKYVIKNPEENKGRWNEIFSNNNPIHIEIGMGKGQFLTKLAIMNPQTNYIGIEKFSSVLIRAIEKRDKYTRENNMEIPNLFFIRMEAETILNVFEKDEVKKIYLNFSDPWPKDRHAKRRLTSKEFLKRYENILDKSGVVEFKTDNLLLFDFSLEQVNEAKWELVFQTKDLHNSQYVDGNIMTEYEVKFSSMGNPICKLVSKSK